VLRVIRLRPPLEPGVSEDEIEGLVEEGRRAGVVEPAEQEIIGNAFWLGERRTIAITTPRTALAWLDAAGTPEDVLRAIRGAPHTRYLVCEGEVDRFLGFVHTRALLAALLAGEPLDLRALARRPLVVPETLPVLALLEQFKEQRLYLAVVVDEYGGVAGITTLSDILEELVGEVPSGAGGRPEITPLPDGGWSVDGLLDLGEAVERLDLGRGEEMARADVNTVGGFVTRRLERVPLEGDAFVWRGHRFEVRSMVGLRVARVWVTPESAAASGDAPAGRPGGGTGG
jgi:putative hemolysin